MGKTDDFAERISVILPIYGVEQYLDRCLESIVNQTYQNLEIILVDDGSPDHCPELCDAWGRRDARIRVIHQEHAGVSAARNAGLAAARGEAVIFLDPDDWIEPEMLEQMFASLMEHDADLVICGLITDYADHSLLRQPPEGLLYGQDALASVFTEQTFSSVCNKLFRRKTLQTKDEKYHLFPVGICIGEDFLWLVRVLNTDRKAISLSKAYYHWCRRGDSSTGYRRMRIQEKDLTMLDAYYEIWKLCRNKRRQLRETATSLYIRGVLLLILARDAAGVEWTREQEFDRLREVFSMESPQSLIDRLVWWKLETIVWMKQHHLPLSVVRLFEKLTKIPGKKRKSRSSQAGNNIALALMPPARRYR